MKPSHTQTPRTLADCNFTTGYAIAPQSTTMENIAYAGAVLAMLAGVIALALAYFDVLVK